MPFLQLENTNTLEAWRAGDQVEVKDGYEALFRKLVEYGSGKPSVDDAALVYTGTGTGLLANLDLKVDGVTETWTLDATSATNFTVTGSVSGAQGDATVDRPYTSSDVSGTATSGSITSLTRTGETFIAKGVRVGDRVHNLTQAEEVFVISVDSETTLTMTTLASGSWNGDSYVVNLPHAALISFEIKNGGTNFISGDDWVIPVTLGVLSADADQWVIDRWDPFADHKSGGDTTNYLHWHGEGDGTEAIYCGIRLEEDGPNVIWNFGMRCFTGYSASQDFENQPGTSPEYFTAFWNQDMPYWVMLNARRYIVEAQVSGSDHGLYQGFFLPYGSPQEYPYPICIHCEKDDPEAWNSGAAGFSAPFVSDFNGATRTVGGVWMLTGTNVSDTIIQKWPRATFQAKPQDLWDNAENFANGDYTLFPIVFRRGTETDVRNPETLGEFDGARMVTGFNNSSGTVITVGGTEHVVFQDIAKSERSDFWALEMS